MSIDQQAPPSDEAVPEHLQWRGLANLLDRYEYDPAMIRDVRGALELAPS